MSNNLDIGQRYRIIIVDDVNIKTAKNIYEKVNGGDNKVIFLTKDTFVNPNNATEETFADLFYRGSLVTKISDLDSTPIPGKDGHQYFLSTMQPDSSSKIRFGTIVDAFKLTECDVVGIYQNQKDNNGNIVEVKNTQSDHVESYDNKIIIETSCVFEDNFNSSDNVLVTSEDKENCSKAFTWEFDNTDVLKKSFDTFYTEPVDGRHEFEIVGDGVVNLIGKSVYDPSKTIELSMTVYKTTKMTSLTILPFDKPIVVDGDVLSINYKFLPEGTTDTSVTWTSSDEEVVIVTSENTITAITPGTVTITGVANDGSGASDSYTFTVYAQTNRITIVPDIDKMYQGEYQKFFAVVTPEDAYQEVAWKVVDGEIVLANADGIVTTSDNVSNPGSDATIMAYTKYENDDSSKPFKYATETFKVYSSKVSGFTIDGFEKPIVVGMDPQQVKYTLTPDDGSGITWVVSDETKASVDENGNVTGLDYGEVTITGTHKGSGESASYTFTVYSATESVVVTPDETKVYVSNMKQFIATVTPETAYQGVEWTSTSNLSITQSGLATALEVGDGVVTATSIDNKVGTEGFEIYKTSTSIEISSDDGTTLSADNISLKVGESKTYTVKVLPDGAEQKVSFSLDNNNVNESNVGATSLTLTGASSGESKLTITTCDGCQKTVTVTVEQSLAGSTISAYDTGIKYNDQEIPLTSETLTISKVDDKNLSITMEPIEDVSDLFDNA